MDNEIAIQLSLLLFLYIFYLHPRMSSNLIISQRSHSGSDSNGPRSTSNTFFIACLISSSIIFQQRSHWNSFEHTTPSYQAPRYDKGRLHLVGHSGNKISYTISRLLLDRKKNPSEPFPANEAVISSEVFLHESDLSPTFVITGKRISQNSFQRQRNPVIQRIYIIGNIKKVILLKSADLGRLDFLSCDRFGTTR